MHRIPNLAAVAAGSALARPRAVAGIVRADTSDPKVMFEQIGKAVEELRARQEEALTGKLDSVLFTTEIAALNEHISNIEALVNEQAKTIVASRLGADREFEGIGPTDPEYVQAFGDWFKTGDDERQIKTSQFAGPRAALSEGSSADGGLLAPVEWDRTITNKLKQRSPIRENARVISISKPGFSKVYNDRTLGSGWVGETAARPNTSTPQLTSLPFSIGEIYANPAATQTILDDAEIDIEAWLASEVEEEFSVQENIAFLSGNGTNKPTGLLNYVTGGANAATHPWGAILGATVAGAAAITTDELVTLVFSLPSERNQNAKFYMNRATLGYIRKLKDGQGNYIWQPSYVAGVPSTLLGYPVIEVPGMPNMTTGLVSIMFGDMEATYLVIDRIGIRVLRDPYTNKPYVNFYTTKRVGGGVQNPEYMRYIKQA